VLLAIIFVYVYAATINPNIIPSVVLSGQPASDRLCLVEGVHAALEYTAAVGAIGIVL